MRLYKASATQLVGRIAVYAAVSLVALTMILPYFWMVSTSLKPPAEIFSLPITLVPKQATFTAYATIFEHYPFLRYFLNSVIVSTGVVAATILVSATGGYAFAKYRFTGSAVIFFLLLSVLMLPSTVIIVPLYTMMVRWHLANTYLALMLPPLISVIGILLARQYIATIPNDLVDSARIDGASEPRIFFVIIFPLCKPVLGAVAIFKFMQTWNDFLWPLIAASDQEMYTVTVGVGVFAGYYGVQWAEFMAAATLATLPIMLVYVFMQRHIIEGVTLTGLKY